MLRRFTAVAKRITNDWLRVYRETLKNLPLDMRYGILPKGVIWKYYPDWYRVDIALGKMKAARFAKYVRAGIFRSDYAGHHRQMSLAFFMKYSELVPSRISAGFQPHIRINFEFNQSYLLSVSLHLVDNILSRPSHGAHCY